jgi:hypothetical protein
MSRVLDGILDDLRVGLERRAARRRRRRAAGATVLTSLALAAVGVSAVGVVAETAPTSTSSSTAAVRLLAGEDCTTLACWPADPSSLNVHKQRSVAAP